MSKSLPRSTPESQGIPSSAINSFLDAIEQQKLELHSVMLLRHGRVVAEGWWAPYRPELPHKMFSLSKSFTSTAIGLTIAEGKLSLDDRVISFFPEEAPASPSANLAAMKVRHLLCMGTGHGADTLSPPFRHDHPNWAEFILQQDVPYEPGTHFVYNSGASYLLSAIVQKVTGETLLDYLTPRIFNPLNIEGATWVSNPQGINAGGWGLSVKTEDVAKFGQLYLQRGKWNGVQLIPETWMEEATSKQIDNGNDPQSDWNQGYGYQFWRCRHDAYRGDGAFGQFCIVMPKQDAVLAITSAVNNMQAVMNAAWDHLLPAMGQAELPPDDRACQALQDRLRALRIDPPAVASSSAMAAEVNGRKYVLDEDGFGLFRSVTLHAQGDTIAEIEAETSNGTIRLPVGNGSWLESASPPIDGEIYRTFASGTWTDPSTYELTLRMLEGPFCSKAVCRFISVREVRIELGMNVSFGPTEFPPMTGRS